MLRGGVGDEHEVSIKSGATVLSRLSQMGESSDLSPLDIFIDRSGDWHVRGIKQNPDRALASVDVVWNALHGEYGEDGTVQRILDRIGIPYTGSGAYASALSMNKILAKEKLAESGVRTPRSVTLSVSPNLDREIVHVFRSFPQPSIIKPVNSGSSVGVTLARSFQDFDRGVRKAFNHSAQILVEEFIQGKEATVGIVEYLRNTPYYSLPPVEIVPANNTQFFDYEAKYGGTTLERCPGNFSDSELISLKQAALAAHTALGLRHYSRSDFIVNPQGIFFLETNTLPSLGATSPFLTSLDAVGVTMNEFIKHVLNLAYEK